MHYLSRDGFRCDLRVDGGLRGEDDPHDGGDAQALHTLPVWGGVHDAIA